jgi:hypothetical protein
VKQLALFAVLVPATLAVAAATAHAETSFFPGVMCQSTNQITYNAPVTNGAGIIGAATGITYFEGPSYSTNGPAYNSRPDIDMWMACPVPRDVVRSDGHGWNTLYATVLNTSKTRSLSCSATTFYDSDYGFGSTAGVSTGPNGNWTDLSLPVISAPNPGYIMLVCVVPRQDAGQAQAGIASYRIDE